MYSLIDGRYIRYRPPSRLGSQVSHSCFFSLLFLPLLPHASWSASLLDNKNKNYFVIISIFDLILDLYSLFFFSPSPFLLCVVKTSTGVS